MSVTPGTIELIAIELSRLLRHVVRAEERGVDRNRIREHESVRIGCAFQQGGNGRRHGSCGSRSVDDLERDEQNTRLLSRLYRLDHLSTRLRRSIAFGERAASVQGIRQPRWRPGLGAPPAGERPRRAVD